jgi:hypothetical protein
VSLVIRKMVGGAVLLLGVFALLFCVRGYGQAREMAEMAGGLGNDAAAWEEHWRTAMIAYASIGLLMAVGGVLIFMGIARGALVAAAAVAGGGVLPWIAAATNYSRFSFESANVVETILLGGMAGFLCVLFLHREKWAG